MTITQPDIRDKRQETRDKILKKTLFIECKKANDFLKKELLCQIFSLNLHSDNKRENII